MSLKWVHLGFIVLSIGLTLWFGLWELNAYSSSRAAGDLTLGILSFVAFVLLIFYAVRFVKKVQREHL